MPNEQPNDDFSASPKKCPFANSNPQIHLMNFTTGKKTTDVLNISSKPIRCSGSSCKGSLMSGQSSILQLRSKEEILKEAQNFQEMYLSFLKKNTPEELSRRMDIIKNEVSTTGTYAMTLDELTFGAKTAWRNASRCIGRIQWNKLHVNDCRNVTTSQEMFEGLCQHLEYATNGGNIRSTITIFPPKIRGRDDFRVWNPQLISFAGYLQPDGSILGDPGKLQFTRVCQRLGWKGKGGRFDVLPLVLSAPGEDVRYFDIPEYLVLTVDLEHLKMEWFRDMELKWYAVPAVSDMLFDVGGICYTAAPFNGWYMATEIGARNLCDSQRYDIAREVAEKMGLDTTTYLSLWKDTVLVETTVAVLHSFQKKRVTIVDHHTAADTFMQHLETEVSLRGGCPADWVWIVPPVGGSATPVFHQEMLNYNLKPSYEYQDKAWITHPWPSVKLRFSFASIAKVARMCLNMMSKARKGRIPATILYASETGKSEAFAKKLEKVLHLSFNAKVICMDEYYINNITVENFVVVIASTFGSGEPPDNGKVFWKGLKELKENRISLNNLKYAVFALGSKQYPNFCNFGKNVDELLSCIGAKRIMNVELGDEMASIENTFNKWLPSIYKASCKDFHIPLNEDMVIPELDSDTWKKGYFRIAKPTNRKGSILLELSKLHNKKLFPVNVLSRRNLQSEKSERQTLLARLSTKESYLPSYEPGDHIGIFPNNPTDIVERILKKLVSTEIKADDVIQTEYLKDDCWKVFNRLPQSNFREYLTHYLDITTPPSPHFLALLSQLATSNSDRHKLELLSKVHEDYEEWKSFRYPNLAEVLEEFPSVRLDPTLLLSELPLLLPRYYSISSSRKAHPDEIHITFGVLSYRTQDNCGPMHYGVCSSFLKNCTDNNIPCFIRSAPRFHLPPNPSTDILLVGAGSGIAPFRSFWQERDALFRSHNGAYHGKAILFFGCRRPDHDDLYRDETSSLVRKGVLTTVHKAFSRHQKACVTPGSISSIVYCCLNRKGRRPKEYVQHKIEKESEMVSDLLLSGGHIYVCGDAVMASDVKEVMNKILSDSNIDVDALVESGQYHEDVFGVLHNNRANKKALSFENISTFITRL